MDVNCNSDPAHLLADLADGDPRILGLQPSALQAHLRVHDERHDEGLLHDNPRHDLRQVNEIAKQRCTTSIGDCSGTSTRTGTGIGSSTCTSTCAVRRKYRHRYRFR
jgi:hypothetical protein